jgi:hypothetical protein
MYVPKRKLDRFHRDVLARLYQVVLFCYLINFLVNFNNLSFQVIGGLFLSVGLCPIEMLLKNKEFVADFLPIDPFFDFGGAHDVLLAVPVFWIF